MSYSDIGFNRRSLVGSILSWTRLNQLLDDEYIFSYLLWFLLLTSLYILMAHVMIRMPLVTKNRLLVIAVFFSPAFMIHLAYATGTLDLPLVMIFVLAVFHARRLFVVALLVGVGILVHELFLFLVPGIIAVRWASDGGLINRDLKRLIAAVSGVSLLTVSVVLAFGSLRWERVRFEELMADRMPSAAGDHQLWSGYFELSSSTSDNASSVEGLISQFSSHWWLASIPISYVLVLTLVIWNFTKLGWLSKLAICIGCLAPLAASLVASDFYRWLSLASIVFILAIVSATASGLTQVPRRWLIALSLFGLLAPFGAAGLDRPFPLHQLVFEKVVGGWGLF